MRADDSDRIVTLSDGSQVMTRAVVLAMEVTYRRLGTPALEALTGCCAVGRGRRIAAAPRRDVPSFDDLSVHSLSQATIETRSRPANTKGRSSRRG